MHTAQLPHVIVEHFNYLVHEIATQIGIVLLFALRKWSTYVDKTCSLALDYGVIIILWFGTQQENRMVNKAAPSLKW